MRPILPIAIVMLSLSGGSMVLSATAQDKPAAPAQDKPAAQQQNKPAAQSQNRPAADQDKAAATQPRKQASRRSAAREAASTKYIGSTYVGTRSAAQGAGKPLKPGGAAYAPASAGQAGSASGQSSGASAQSGGAAGDEEWVSPGRGTLATEGGARPASSQDARPPGAQGDGQSQTPQPGSAQGQGAQANKSQAPAQSAQAGASGDAKSFDVKSNFRNICSFCHQDYGRHAGRGPQLMDSPRSDEFLFDRIKNGLQGRMPGFGGTFNDAQIHQFVEFIRNLKPNEEPKNPA